MECNKKHKEQITIQFNFDCLECDNEECFDNKTNNIDVFLSSKVTPVHLLWILTRSMIGALVASSTNIQDLLFNACHASANLAVEIQNFTKDVFGIKMHIKPEKENLN